MIRALGIASLLLHFLGFFAAGLAGNGPRGWTFWGQVALAVMSLHLLGRERSRKPSAGRQAGVFLIAGFGGLIVQFTGYLLSASFEIPLPMPMYLGLSVTGLIAGRLASFLADRESGT